VPNQRKKVVPLLAVTVMLVSVLLAPVSVLGSPSRAEGLAVGRFTYDSGPEAGTPAPGSPDPAPTANLPPVIDVWYGTTQRFGHLGIPQPWVNILGNVWDPDGDGISSLTYSLNGGAPQALTVGPDPWRLVRAGDFNVEIRYTRLGSGGNSVVLEATDARGATTTREVTVNWSGGNVWSNPYYVDWASVGDIQDVAQIVDGLWAVDGSTIAPVIPGYDRAVAVGDLTWQDYDVTVPITIQRFYGGAPGVGILVRWAGHADDTKQPHYAPLLGALGWYRYYPTQPVPWLAILGMDNENLAVDPNRVLNLGVPYIFKMRIETIGADTRYRLKVWRAADSEPAGWDLEGYGNDPARTRGSILLLAHRADATFGSVTITPLQGGYTLQVAATPSEAGTVGWQPNQPSYTYGEVVTLTPTAASGWTFARWEGPDGGDVVDKGNGTWTLAIVKNREVTARFAPTECTLTLEKEAEDQKGNMMPGFGSHVYDCGARITLSPGPDPGWSFGGWGGASAADPEDKGDGTWSLLMDGDKQLIARFVEDEYELAVVIEPAGWGTVEKEPNLDTYRYGDIVQLTAVAEPGWEFSGWSGDLTGNTNPITVTMTGSRAVVATFEEGRYDVRVTVEGMGEVRRVPDPPYDYLQNVTLTPIPAARWRFAGWGGADAGLLNDNGNGTWSLPITGNMEVTATFVNYRVFLPVVSVVHGQQ
jgi:hypothetical protein